MQAITKTFWDEKRQVLYTGSKDKSIKVWRVPEQWNVYSPKPEEKPAPAPAPIVEKKEKTHAEGSDEDSDGDDDLKGWAKK